MLFDALQKLSGRTPVNNKYPYQADAKLEVVAKATDPFVQQGLGGQDVIKALSAINPMLKSYGDVQEVNKADNAAQAKADEAAGTFNKPDSFLNTGVGYSDTWKMTHGEAQMSKVSSQHLQDLKDHNYFINEPDPQAAIKKNYDDHYGSLFTEADTQDKYVMAGASEHYHATEAAAAQGYLSAFNAKKMVTHEQDINDTAISTVQDYFRNNPDGTRDPVAVRQLLSTLRHSVDPSVFPESKVGAVVTNALVGAARANMQDTKIPLHQREEFNSMVLESLRQSDKDGVSWYKTLDATTGKPLNRSMVDEAEAHLHKMGEDEEHKAEEKQKKDQVENSGGINAAILSARRSKDLASFLPLIQEGADQGYINRADLAQMTHMIKTLQQGGGHIIEDPAKIFSLTNNVMTGKVKRSEVYSELAAERIRPDTAEKLLGIFQRHDDHLAALKAENKATDQQLFTQSYTQQHSVLYNAYYKTDDQGKPDTESAERWGAVQDYYNDLVYNQKKSPVAAKVEILKTFPAEGAMGGFKTAEEAQAAGRAAKFKYTNGQMSKKEYDSIAARVRPWAYRHRNQH